jgi:O-succinylbenzoate synthase
MPQHQTYAPLRIDGTEMRLVSLPLVTPFTIATGTMHDKTFPLLILKADGLEGYGEGVMDPLPDYLDESITGSMDFVRTVLLPQVIGKSFANPAALEALLTPWRGSYMAKAMVEMAFWDLWAKSLSLPLTTLLGGTRGDIDVGVSLGITSVEETVKRAVAHHDLGYKRIKLKIKPGWDLEPTRAVRNAWPNILLQVDANSIYHLSDAEHLAKLDEFNLLLIEQPLAHDDIFDHAKLQGKVKSPICLDESIVSPEHARWALEMNACGVINIKPSRIGGLADAKRIHDMAQAAGIPVWHGGMLETGIGRTTNVALASLPNFTLPGDISANDRYYKRDIVKNPFTLNADSTLTVLTTPGNGAVVDEDFLETVTVAKVEMRNK